MDEDRDEECDGEAYELFNVETTDGRGVRRVCQVAASAAHEAVGLAMHRDEKVNAADHGATVFIRCSRVVGRRVRAERPFVL